MSFCLCGQDQNNNNQCLLLFWSGIYLSELLSAQLNSVLRLKLQIDFRKVDLSRLIEKSIISQFTRVKSRLIRLFKRVRDRQEIPPDPLPPPLFSSSKTSGFQLSPSPLFSSSYSSGLNLKICNFFQFSLFKLKVWTLLIALVVIICLSRLKS